MCSITDDKATSPPATAATPATPVGLSQLRGVHTGVGLRFVLRLARRPAGWQYQLLLFEVRSPTGHPDVIHWLPLHRLLDEPDFRPDVLSFQQQLQRALILL